MLITLLIIGGVIAFLSAFSIVSYQSFKISYGAIIVDENYNGPSLVSSTIKVIVRFLMRRSIHLRKFLVQYIMHFFVRFMFYLDKWFSILYAKSRDTFYKNAVKNRGTVPHFWNHLKVYKQEMDKEKEEQDDN